ncbi:MAG: hypothetical protein ACP5HK_01210 [Acidilobus sp.]
MLVIEHLDSDDDGLSSRAWYEAVVNKVVPPDELAPKLRRLLELLLSPSREARSLAWAAAAELVITSTLPKDEVSTRKGALIELLKTRGPSIDAFVRAWETAEKLAKVGALSVDDLRPLSELLWDMADRATGKDKDRLKAVAERLRKAGLIKGPGLRARVLGEDSYIL